MINPSNLLSDEERMKLQAWGQEIDRPCWKIGYFVVERLQEIIDNEKVNIPKMSLYKEVGKEVGKSAETVRGYYYVCSHVPKCVYMDFAENYTFSQFRRLVSICSVGCNTQEERYYSYESKLMEWENYCLRNTVPLTSVDALTAWLNKDKNKEPQERKWLRQLVKYAEKLEASSNVPTQIVQLIMHFTAKLEILVREIWMTSKH